MVNYVTKSDVKNATAVDTSKSAKEVDLAGLKSVAVKLDVDKLKTVPVDINNPSDIVTNDV